MKNAIIFCICSLALLSSCEDSMILKSEKKMKQDLQGTWERQTQGLYPVFRCGVDSFYFTENWVFSGNNYYTVFFYEAANTCDRGTPDLNLLDKADTAIVGTFKVDTRIFDAFLKLQWISGADTLTPFIDKWEFVTLDKDVLYLATDDPRSNSVVQREFYKIK